MPKIYKRVGVNFIIKLNMANVNEDKIFPKKDDSKEIHSPKPEPTTEGKLPLND